ncbi:MAG: ROK family protein, partial [Mariprofundales bacterium]|nr:ROK family protein [Mariprofundales bacterium]
MRSVIAVDIGGTHLRAAVVNELGKVVGGVQRVRSNFSSLDGVSCDEVLTLIAESLQSAVTQLGSLQEGVESIGIGFPGYISRGVVMGAPNIPALHEVDLARELSQRLQRVVVIDNDANCAAFGEWRFGAGGRAESLLHLTLGTGVGGGYLRRGVIFGGDSGMALEMGHLRV